MAIAPTPFDDAPRVVHDLYERHARALRAFCLRSLRNRDDADEAVQTTFVRALGAVRNGVRPSSERAWLLTIARNVCATRATCAQRRHEVVVDVSAFEEVEAAVSMPELGGDPDLVAALEALPEGQRRAFVLRAVHELTYEEIARELGVSHAAVETWIFRARRKLAEAVADRRRRLAADLASAGGLLKSFLTGGAAVNAGGAALAVVAVGTAIAVAPNEASPPRRAPFAPAVERPVVERPATTKLTDDAKKQTPTARPMPAEPPAEATALPPAPTQPTQPTATTDAPTPASAPAAESTPPSEQPALVHARPTSPPLPSTPLDPVVEPVQETLAPITDQLPLPDLTEPVQAPQLPQLPVDPPELAPLLP